MRQILIILVFLGFCSCSGLKVTSNYDGEVDFSAYKTYSYYGWDEHSTRINAMDRQLIEHFFAQEFKQRGLSYDPSGEGDIVVSLLLVIESEKAVQAYNSYYGQGPYGFYQPAWGWAYGYRTPYTYGGVEYREYNYRTGTLVCDVFDKNSKRIVWQGVASKSLHESNKDRETAIRLSINRLMQEFPRDLQN